MSRFFITSLLFLAFAPVLRAGDQITPDQFKAITAKAQDMDHTTVGEAYLVHFQDAVSEQVGQAVKACTAHSNIPAPYYIDVVVVIVNGRVEALVADPQNPVAACVASKLGRLSVPKPPRDEWMQLLDIHVGK